MSGLPENVCSCSENFYREITNGVMTCAKCPAKSTSQSNSVSPIDCKCNEGYYPTDDNHAACSRPDWITADKCDKDLQFLNDTSLVKFDWNCVECPAGANCTRQTTLSKLRMKDIGYWEAPWGEKPSYHKCPTRENCQVGAASAAAAAALITSSNSSNASNVCVGNTHGPLCAVCNPSHFKDSSGVCRACKGGINFSQLGFFAGVLFLLLFILYSFKKKLKQLYRKLGKDMMRIITINVGFAQINSSLSSVIDVPWPESYMSYIHGWDFVNFDATSLLSLGCVSGDGLDYRARVAVASAVPFVVAFVWLCIYVKRRTRATSSQQHQSKKFVEKAAEQIFQHMDKDDSGILDARELGEMLRMVGCVGKNDDATTNDMILDLGAVGKPLGVSKQDFIDKLAMHVMQNTVDLGASSNAVDGKRQKRRRKSSFVLNKSITALKIIQWSALQRARSSSLSGALYLLFFLHAPVSSRIFVYFLCDDIDGKTFLRADFSLSCQEKEYKRFYSFVMFMMIIFVVGFPVLIFLLLCNQRKHLQTPTVRSSLGFLYASFRPNAEYWEVHELIRKLILMGALMLVYHPQVRVALALMVCVISIATLNYFRPHKSSIVFSVAQASFLLTALKYLVAIILEGMKNSKDREEFGAFLILVDVCFVVASLFSMATVGYLFIKNIGGDVAPKVEVKARGLQKVHPSLNLEHTHIELAVQKNSDSDNNNNNTRVQGTPKHSFSRTQMINSINAAVVHNKVIEVQKSSAKHLQTHTEKVLKRKTTASRRLQQRLSKQKSIKSAAHTTIIEERIIHSLVVAESEFENGSEFDLGNIDVINSKVAKTFNNTGAEINDAEFVAESEFENGSEFDLGNIDVINSKVARTFNNNTGAEINDAEFKVEESTIPLEVSESPELTPAVSIVDVPHANIESLIEVKCQNTKAILLKTLKTKKKLYKFMTRADKKQSGWLRRKHVETLIDRIRKKSQQVVAFDDNVWRSMKSKSKLGKQNFVEHEVFAQWVFDDDTTA